MDLFSVSEKRLLLLYLIPHSAPNLPKPSHMKTDGDNLAKGSINQKGINKNITEV